MFYQLQGWDDGGDGFIWPCFKHVFVSFNMIVNNYYALNFPNMAAPCGKTGYCHYTIIYCRLWLGYIILTLTSGVSTMRLIEGSADTALLCTTCIHVVCCIAGER